MDQQAAEPDAPAVLPEQPAQDQTVPDQSQQPLVTNGIDLAMPVTQLDPNGFMLATQDPNFAAMPSVGGTNGIAFTDPAMMMMGSAQMDLPTMALPQQTNGKTITADEIALYDRQIRLWGMKAQQRIQNANILLITLKALATEIAKNLILAGIGSLTIVDDEKVTEADLGAGFSLTQDHIGQNRAQAAAENLRKLNPRVQVFPDPNGIMTKGASYFAGFDIVIATDLNPTTLAFINTATRLYGRQFYAAASHGFYGYIFSDLIEHDYVLERVIPNVATKVGEESRTRSVIDVKTKEEGGKKMEIVTKRELYSTWDLASETSLLPPEYRNSKRKLKTVTPALPCLRALWNFQATQNRNPGPNRQDLEAFTKAATMNHQLLSLPSETLKSEFLRSFLQNIGSEIAPVTAILGGQLSQDVINVLGVNQAPIQNMVIFDGNKMSADMYALHPESEVKLGKAQLDMMMGGMTTTQVEPVLPNDQQFGSVPAFSGTAGVAQ